MASPNNPTPTTAPSARTTVAALEPLGARLRAALEKAAAAGDGAVPAEVGPELAAIAKALGDAAGEAARVDTMKAADGWPRDMSAGALASPAWGRDPEALRHG
jgi:hypothetical protein